VKDALLVAVGGSIGALTRYATGWAAAKVLGKDFPWGTLAVNLVGCFIMGLVLEVLADLESTAAVAGTRTTQFQIAFWRQGVAIGFLGALTTFSSFGADVIRQVEAGRAATSLINIAANVVLSLSAVWLGVILMRAIR
jgi:CrcB protein